MSQVLKEFTKVERLVGRKILVAPKGIENPTRYEVQVLGYSQAGFMICNENGKEKQLSAEEVTISAEGIADFEKKLLLESTDVIPIITGHWTNELGSKVIYLISMEILRMILVSW